MKTFVFWHWKIPQRPVFPNLASGVPSASTGSDQGKPLSRGQFIEAVILAAWLGWRSVGRRQTRKEITVCSEHMAGNQVVGQKLEQFPDIKILGMMAITEVDGAIDECAMGGGMFLGAWKSGSRYDRFLVLKMVDNVANQGVYQRGCLIRRVRGE